MIGESARIDGRSAAARASVNNIWGAKERIQEVVTTFSNRKGRKQSSSQQSERQGAPTKEPALAAFFILALLLAVRSGKMRVKLLRYRVSMINETLTAQLERPYKGDQLWTFGGQQALVLRSCAPVGGCPRPAAVVTLRGSVDNMDSGGDWHHRSTR